jgi:hypothetical protein
LKGRPLWPGRRMRPFTADRTSSRSRFSSPPGFRGS